MKLFRPCAGEGGGAAAPRCARVCWENSSATAGIIRKINYFPSLLINFTIASMFLLPAWLLSWPLLRCMHVGKKTARESLAEEERRTKTDERESERG